MAKKKTMKKDMEFKIESKCKSACNCDSSCVAYLLGFLGAAIYYISQATGFWNGVLGFLKALV